jgi:hypothetical protein
MLDKYSMATIQELESFKLSDAVDFHEELNPRLWDDEKLDPEVRDQLLLIAEDFVEYLGLDNLKVEDVTISGSNAAYSYTPHSDLDLHILVDFNNLPNDPVYQELFTAKKTLYNDAHDITVRGVPVELYVQDTNQTHTSLGEYSVVYDKWIRIPKKRRANFDQAATKLKYEKLGDLIELAIKSRNPKKVKDTIDLIKRYRKAGLEKAGEFGPENLAFKAIRKQGLIQDLYDLKAELHGEKLSIEEDVTDLQVYRNPSPKQLYRLTQRSAHKHMRGMYHDGDTYWWDGNDAIHKQGSDYLGIPYDYQMRIEAAIDSVSDNYRVGGDDGVPQDIIQKYDIENELVYEASAISMYSDWKDLPYETLNAIVNYYYSQDEADADYNERVLRQLGFSIQTNDSPDNYENVLASSIKTNKKYLVPVPAAQEYCDKIYDEQYSDDDSATPENEAAAWEEGWNAHESGKPISANPYKTASSKWDPIEKHMWDQGWNAAKEDPYLREASERHPYPYGYWIDITGEVVPVESYNGHEAVGRAIMQKYDRRTKKGKIGDSLNLFYSGAIRVVTYNYPDMEIEICEPNRKAARSMVRMLRELQPTKVYYENNCQINGPKNSGTWQEASRWVTQQATDPNYYDNLKQAALDKQISEASGYIPSEKEKNDPRFKMALSVDVKPNSIKKNAKAFGFKTSRAGVPPQARADGKIAEDLMREWKSFLAEDEQQELFPGYDEKHRQERLNAWLGKSRAMAGKKPKVLYHATTKEFDEFRVQNQGWVSGSLIGNVQIDRTGIFLAENPKFAEEFIKNTGSGPEWKENAVIIPVYLSAQYPFSLLDNSLLPMLSDEALVEKFNEHDIDLKSIYHHYYEDKRWELFDGPEGQDFVQNLKRLGYDSAVMQEEAQSHGGSETVWVAFNPAQVKAITNRGSFSPDDPRMMKESG